MKKLILIALTIGAGLLLLQSCSKKKGCTDPVSINYDAEAEKDNGSCEYGGTGGDATIVAIPKHHDSTIVSTPSWPDSAFVKFNAINAPLALTNYDLVLVSDSGENQIHISGLKRGKYYIHMTGFDTGENKRVSGGTAYILNQSVGQVEVVIAVSED